MANEVRTAVHNVLANKTIDYAHHEAHIGRMNYANINFTSVVNGNSANVLISVSSSKEAHLSFAVNSNGPALIHFYENYLPHASSYGNILSAVNMNRNFTTSAGTIFHGSTNTLGADTGTLLFKSLMVGDTGGGSGINLKQPVGGEARNGIEWILKPATNYLLSIITTSGSIRDIHFETEFYEE